MSKTMKILRISMILLAAAVIFSVVSNLITNAAQNHITAMVSQDKKIYSEAVMLRKNISALVSAQTSLSVLPDGVNGSFESVKSALEFFAVVRPENSAEINAIMKGAVLLKDNALAGKITQGSWRLFGQVDEFVGSAIKSAAGKNYKLSGWVFFISFFGRLIWAAFFAVFAGFVFYGVSGLYKEGFLRNTIKENRIVSGLTGFINLVM
ncbi:MAG: hypothetical protein CVV21_00615 [Candidatus Goldiibacteriota bacterium HGW-Goldbacteria-1]|jgi:hypothetical protein|nr:MAG: hypothetical protein CVV21_00615 [Candidatus Goldiibacteriota bacterium HGW-Goldbacteria-1]